MKRIPPWVIGSVAAALAAATLLTIWWPYAEPAHVIPAAAQADPFPFVRSLAGTSPDAELHADSSDALVVDAALGRLFDYYLSALGEKSLDAIRAEIEAELGRRLKQPAAAEARRLMGRYLDYKRALVGVEVKLEKLTSSVDAARERMVAMQEIRARFFSLTESQGLFGLDDAYNADAIARMELSQNTALPATEKEHQLAELDAHLPPALREARDAPRQVIQLEQAVAKLRAAGGSDDEVYRLRAATLTPEAANRLSDLDRDETRWQQRIAQYLSERKALLADRGAPGADRQVDLHRLRDAEFSIEEQPRLVAYER